MKTAVLVAPFFQENTLRYLAELAKLPETRAVVISQDAATRIPEALRAQVDGHFRVDDCLDGGQLAEACRKIGHVDRVLGVLEQLQLPIAIARERCGIEGMWREAARNFRDKAVMKDVLRAHDLPCARHKLVESDGDAWQLIAEVGYPIILKPVDGLGSRGTYRIRNDEELRQALKGLKPSIDRPLQAEEFVTGEENTFETVTIHGKPVWHSGTHYLPGPLEVLENPWMQYCVVLPREANQGEFKAFIPTNTAALAALGMETGLSHMEWFLRADGRACISEVGARPPGVQIMPMMSIAHDTDMIANWTRLMVHDQFEPVTRKFAVGAAFFRGQGKGSRVLAVHGIAQANEEVGAYVVDRLLPRAGQSAASSYEGEGWAIVKADDTKTVMHALKRLISLVRVELG